MRLANGIALSTGVIRSTYDRDAQKTGIVHFGIGAFHRAHQALYTDEAMQAGDTDWMITGISLRSPIVADQLNPQSGLYSVLVRGQDETTIQVIRSVRNVIVASEQPDDVIEAVASPATRIISFTITEKGYHRTGEGLLNFDEIEGASARPSTIYGFLTSGLRRRMIDCLPGVTLLSCDNLASNGKQLKALLLSYLDRYQPDLASWVAQNCTFPSTMIDRIVPATTPDDLEQAESMLGARDEAAVVTEPFSQWVIEDDFVAGRPHWELCGAQMAENVNIFEKAKLRLLNGSHSALAYLGLQRGYNYVHEAIADPELAALVQKLMMGEAAPTVDLPAHQLAEYTSSLVERFSNNALPHRLVQIAMDGSQKFPQRWLETLAAQQRLGRDCPAILAAMNAWLDHIAGGENVNDPMAPELSKLISGLSRNDAIMAVFGQGGPLRSAWHPILLEKIAI